MTSGFGDDVFAPQRRRMVERDLRARGVRDARVLAAMGKVRRERYVPRSLRHRSYDDGALPIGAGQTISQPWVVAYMVEALGLASGDRVLEIGTGSGYAAAVLAEMVAEVCTIERLAELADGAWAALAADGYRNVRVRTGDGTRGWPEHAPFDAIIVAAGAESVPEPLLAQLAPRGRLIMPVGRNSDELRLTRVRRTENGECPAERLAGVRFVPLIAD